MHLINWVPTALLAFQAPTTSLLCNNTVVTTFVSYEVALRHSGEHIWLISLHLYSWEDAYHSTVSS